MRSARRLAVLPFLLLAVLAACSDDSSEPASSDDGVTRTGDCEWRPGGQAAADVDPPAEDARAATTLVFETNLGDVPLELDPDKCASISITSLAEQGYYDDTSCHRMMVPMEGAQVGFVQCGDPTGNGTGGPGYLFDDQLNGDETYSEGTLAMAKSGPDENGGQFFLNFADSDFDPDYTLFGTITPEGLKVLEQVEAAGIEGGAMDGAPAEPFTIETARVED